MLRNLLAAALLAASCLPAAATDYEVGGLTVERPWARAMPPMTKVGAGYLGVANAGDAADRLVSVETPRAREVQIHEMSMENGVAKMRHMPDGLEIPAGGSATLQPGGYHLMFMGVEQSFEEGETVPATLTFEKAGSVEVEFEVAPVGAPAPASAAGGAMDHTGGKTE